MEKNSAPASSPTSISKTASIAEPSEDFQTFIKRVKRDEAIQAAESKLTVSVKARWFEVLKSLHASINDPQNTAAIESSSQEAPISSVQLVDKLKREGASLMEAELAQYRREVQATTSKSDLDWMKTVMKGGTFSDRCSALTLAFQTSPFHGLEHFKGLLEMCKSKSRQESNEALNALKDLLTSADVRILPADRKLRYIHQQEGLGGLKSFSSDLRRRIVCIWYWEDAFKASYLELIKILEASAQDVILYGRERACRLLFDLLQSNPQEQEGNILALLANKLGDGERRLSSRIPYYFTELVNAHAQTLTGPAIEQVRSVIDRSGVTDRTRYHALCFLIQIRLARGMPAITASLLQIYLGLFNRYIVNNLEAAMLKGSKKDAQRRRQKRIRHRQKLRGEPVEEVDVPEEHARLAKALLTGINRAFPFASGAGEELKSILMGFSEPLLKLCQPSVAFPTTLQALNLLLSLAPFDLNLRGKVLRHIQLILDEQDRLRQASASHLLFLRALLRAANLLIELKDFVALQAVLKSLLRFCLSLLSPAFVVGSLALVAVLLARCPILKAMLNTAPEGGDNAMATAGAKGSNGLFELIALTRHYQPRVRRYALALLQEARIPGDSASDQAVNNDPFEKLSFTTLLDVWNKMRRVKSGRSADKDAGRGAVLADSDSDSENMNLSQKPEQPGKTSDNSRTAAFYYQMDEYHFIKQFIEDKDAEQEKLAAKLQKRRRPATEDSDLEAEADEVMEEAIRTQVGDDSDEDEAYSEEGSDFAGDSGSGEEDLDADSDADDLAAMTVDSDFDFEDQELEDGEGGQVQEDEEDSFEPALETTPATEANDSHSKAKKKKKFKGVFASASDYEDALLD